ncbi:MAG: hypothetical protein EOP07_09800 [Proteobacteria bacterium]|nr:MAG: hypothetical protein EOP07_09800 [Pseudomonadota bacterium]
MKNLCKVSVLILTVSGACSKVSKPDINSKAATSGDLGTAAGVESVDSKKAVLEDKAKNNGNEQDPVENPDIYTIEAGFTICNGGEALPFPCEIVKRDGKLIYVPGIDWGKLEHSWTQTYEVTLGLGVSPEHMPADFSGTPRPVLKIISATPAEAGKTIELSHPGYAISVLKHVIAIKGEDLILRDTAKVICEDAAVCTALKTYLSNVEKCDIKLDIIFQGTPALPLLLKSFTKSECESKK